LRKSTVIDFVCKSLYVSADLDTSTVLEGLRKTIANIHSYFALILLNILSHLYQARIYFIKHIHISMNRGVVMGSRKCFLWYYSSEKLKEHGSFR